MPHPAASLEQAVPSAGFRAQRAALPQPSPHSKFMELLVNQSLLLILLLCALMVSFKNTREKNQKGCITQSHSWMIYYPSTHHTLENWCFLPTHIITHCQQSDWCSVSALTDRKICRDKNLGKRGKKGKNCWLKPDANVPTPGVNRAG